MGIVIGTVATESFPESARNKWADCWSAVDSMLELPEEERGVVEIKVDSMADARSIASNGGSMYRETCKTARQGKVVFFRALTADEIAKRTEEEGS